MTRSEEAHDKAYPTIQRVHDEAYPTVHPAGAMFGRLFCLQEENEGEGTAAARKIPAGVKHLSKDGKLNFKGDFDAAELERLVGEYGPAIKAAVDLG